MTVACGKGHESAVQSPANAVSSPVAAAEDGLQVPKEPTPSSSAQKLPSVVEPENGPVPGAVANDTQPSAPADDVAPVPPVDVTPQPENPTPVPSPLEEAKAQLIASDANVSSILMELFDFGIESYPLIRQGLRNALTTLPNDLANRQAYMMVYKADLQETQDSLDILRAKAVLSGSENELISQLTILLSTQKLKVETLETQINSTQTLLDQIVVIVSYMEIDRPKLIEIIKNLEAEQA